MRCHVQIHSVFESRVTPSRIYYTCRTASRIQSAPSINGRDDGDDDAACRRLDGLAAGLAHRETRIDRIN